MIEIQIKRHPKCADEWRFVIYNRGKPVAFSRNYYTRKISAMRGAKRLVAAMFQTECYRGVRITEKGK